MLIEATTQTTEGHTYILTGNDDLNVGLGVTIRSTLTDAVTTWIGQHTFTVEGTIIGEDECINTIGCEAAQTVIIGATAQLTSGGDGVVTDADGVILDGIGSMMTNAGHINSYGSCASVFVRDAGTTTVSNSGVMVGRVAGIWHKFGIGTFIINNTGSIESPHNAILGGASADIVTNSGIMTGTVDLAGGNDVLNNRTGTIIGAILGGDGDDRFVLGATAENIDGGAGFDTLDLSSYTKGVTVNLADATVNFGIAVSGDTFAGIEAILGTTRADVLVGDAGDNAFYGNGSGDKLTGGAGADTLDGGARMDTLTGGDGADMFQFRASIDMNDRITDFTVGQDHLLFEGSAFGYGDTTGAVSADDFIVRTSRMALDATDHFIFRTTDHSLWYDVDGVGGKGSVAVAYFQNGITLSAADLLLI
jgi:Ca2+-binding RTX toxin-like protein